MVLSRRAGRTSRSAADERVPIALWYVPVADLGGAARHVLDAVRAGVPGWRLVVLCPEGPLAERLRARGDAVVTGPVGPADGARTAVRAVRRTLRRLGPDVLHTHLAFADLVGTAAVTGLRSGAGRRIRLVSTEHGISGIAGMYQRSATGARVKIALHRARLRRADVVIAVSESTREQILRQWGSGAAVAVIRNGVDFPERGPVERANGGLRVLSLARLAPEKGIDDLLRAFALLRREHPEARLTIAGIGPCEQELRDLAARLRIADAVTFPGHVEPEQALAVHDVVAQLSRWENLSYTLLDARARGLGAVATDVGGNREILPAHCLVDAQDPAAVARAIVEQGTRVERRPVAREDEETVARMCGRIGEVYAGVRG